MIGCKWGALCVPSAPCVGSSAAVLRLGGCVCVHVHAYTGLRRRGWFVETMHSILFHHRKGPTVQPRLPRRYSGGRGYIMLFSFSFEFFAAHKYSLLIHDLFSRMVTRFGLFGEFFSWSWGGWGKKWDGFFLNRINIFVNLRLKVRYVLMEERMGKFYPILEQNTWEISKFVKRGHIENSIYET